MTEYTIKVTERGWILLHIDGQFIASTDDMEVILETIRVWHRTR